MSDARAVFVYSKPPEKAHEQAVVKFPGTPAA
jgi:hypothetical protein